MLEITRRTELKYLVCICLISIGFNCFAMDIAAVRACNQGENKQEMQVIRDAIGAVKKNCPYLEGINPISADQDPFEGLETCYEVLDVYQGHLARLVLTADSMSFDECSEEPLHAIE